MSTNLSQVEFAAATAFAPAPILLATSHSNSPVVVPSGTKQTCTFPVPVANGNGPFTSYPPQYGNDDERLLYTYASFRQEPVTAPSFNRRLNDAWILCIPLPIPSGINNPTLLGLNYMINYVTTYDERNSTIQMDTILTTETLPEGVLGGCKDLKVYKDEIGYAPRMVNHDLALRLSTTLAVKCNGGGEQWSHYVDNQHIAANTRILDAKSRLYVLLHFNEHPTVKTVRSLSVEVSATWQKEEVEKKAIEEAKKKAKEEADKCAKEEAERRDKEMKEQQARDEERAAREEQKQAREEEKRAREEEKQAREEEKRVKAEEKAAREEEKRAREEEKQAREEEKAAREAEKQAREEEKAAREAEKQAREEEKRAREEETQAKKKEKRSEEVAKLPAAADHHVQNRIKDAMASLPVDRRCQNGYAWKKTAEGYQCEGGGHKITFEELGL